MKREPVGNEQDGWLGTSLRQTRATAPDGCVDAETLAAWADGGLTAKAASAVELHVSSCSRCMGVLAAMERSAPAASATHAWTPARVFRWLAPLTAAATAVALWIAVSGRPITPIEPVPAHDSAAPEPGTPNPNPEPSTQNLEPQIQSAPSVRVDKPAAAEEQMKMRDEIRREGAASPALGAAAAPEPPRPAAPPAAGPPPASTDARAETFAATAQRSALKSVTMSTDSVSPSNPLIRWRIVASVSIERSVDGGKTWIKTTAPASTVVGVRAVDGERAVARTPDSAEFYTTDGGVSWTRVQENSAAPF